MNEHFLAVARGISQLSLVAAVHPPDTAPRPGQAALLAQVRASTCTDLLAVSRCSMARPAR